MHGIPSAHCTSVTHAQHPKTNVTLPTVVKYSIVPAPYLCYSLVCQNLGQQIPAQTRHPKSCAGPATGCHHTGWQQLTTNLAGLVGILRRLTGAPTPREGMVRQCHVDGEKNHTASRHESPHQTATVDSHTNDANTLSDIIQPPQHTTSKTSSLLQLLQNKLSYHHTHLANNGRRYPKPEPATPSVSFHTRINPSVVQDFMPNT